MNQNTTLNAPVVISHHICIPETLILLLINANALPVGSAHSALHINHLYFQGNGLSR